MASHAYKSEDEWHALRRRTVGASEVGALFGVSPFKTAWQLHMEKAGHLEPPDLDDNERVREGRFFEPAIAGLAAEKWGMKLRKTRRYLTADDCPGMGCSLDYEALVDGTWCPVELKWSLFGGAEWQFDADEILDAPLGYLLQLQHQLGCLKAPQGYLVAFVGGRVRRGVFDRRDDLIKEIKARITAFWAAIAAGETPEPDFDRDGEDIARLASARSLGLLALTGNEAAEKALSSYQAAAAEAKDAARVADAAKAELTHIIIEESAAMGLNTDQDKCGAVIGANRVSLPLIQPTPPTLITPEMIGTSYGGRKGYRRFSVSQIKEGTK